MKTRRITVIIALAFASISLSCKAQVQASEVRISQDSLFFRNDFVGLGSQRYGASTPVTEFYTDLDLDKQTIKGIEATASQLLGHTAFLYKGSNPRPYSTSLQSTTPQSNSTGVYLTEAGDHMKNLGHTLIVQATAVPLLIAISPYIGVPVGIGTFIYEVVQIYSVSKSLIAAGDSMSSSENKLPVN